MANKFREKKMATRGEIGKEIRLASVNGILKLTPFTLQMAK